MEYFEVCFQDLSFVDLFLKFVFRLFDAYTQYFNRLLWSILKFVFKICLSLSRSRLVSISPTSGFFLFCSFNISRI